ncbi:MAG: hypothetical protein ACLQU4_15035 [Limisphaerales bacterium]
MEILKTVYWFLPVQRFGLELLRGLAQDKLPVLSQEAYLISCGWQIKASKEKMAEGTRETAKFEPAFLLTLLKEAA